VKNSHFKVYFTYIGQDQSVTLEELQLWMLHIVYVEESGAANGYVIKMTAAIHADGSCRTWTTKLIRSLTEQQLRGLGLKGGHAPHPPDLHQYSPNGESGECQQRRHRSLY
jgi:hypothetical protein